MLNLLPHQIKERYHVVSKIYGLIGAYITVLAVIGLLLAGLATYAQILGTTAESREVSIAALKATKQQYKDLAEQAAFVEDRAKSVSQYREREKWEQFLASLADSTPTDVKLTSVQFTTEANKPAKIRVAGEAADRRSIVLFRDKLSSLDSLTGVQITILGETKQEKESKLYTFTLEAVKKGGANATTQ